MSAPAVTRPDSDQILVRSSKTGERTLDDYIEEAEVGGLRLGQLLAQLFSPVNGLVRSDIVQFRVNSGTLALEFRSGDYAQPEVGWVQTGAFFGRYRGDWATGAVYSATEYVRIGQTIYVCISNHTAGASPDMSRFQSLVGSVVLDAIGTASGAAADRVPYMTGPGTAAFAVLTAFARSLLATTDAAAARVALGVTAAGTMDLAAAPTINMAGRLFLSGAPTANNEAATKAYTDAQALSTAQSVAMQTALPFQAGNAGRFVKTDGTNASWASLDSEPPIQRANRARALGHIRAGVI